MSLPTTSEVASVCCGYGWRLRGIRGMDAEFSLQGCTCGVPESAILTTTKSERIRSRVLHVILKQAKPSTVQFYSLCKKEYSA
jgi:hypothetical protein